VRVIGWAKQQKSEQAGKFDRERRTELTHFFFLVLMFLRKIIYAMIFRPMCPQDTQESNSLSTLMLGLPGPGFEFSERDCLNLNVFAPRCIVGQVPVICYIHGGLSQGGIALPKHGK
jgi:hypothetical protein